MNKLSLIGLIKEESGEKGFAELILRNLVKAGEKTLPKEVGRYEVNGVKMVLKAESYTYLMTKSALSNEERQIIRQVNRNIVNILGEDIFVVAIKEATRGLDRIGTKTVESRILNNYFDGESIARIENKLRPDGHGSVQLPSVIEREIEREINTIPECGPIANNELPDLTDVTTENTITILKNKAEKNGIKADDDFIEKLLETVNKSVDSNRELAGAINKQSDVIMSQAAEKIQSSKTNPLGNEIPKPSKNVDPKLGRVMKKIFMSGKGYKEVTALNRKLTILQVASVLIDVFGTNKGFKDLDQPITGLNVYEIMGTKIVAGVADHMLMGLGTGGKLLLAINYALSAIDVSAMAIDLYRYHGPRKERQKQEKDKEEKDKQRAKQDSIELEKLKQRGKDSLNKIKVDSLKQKYSVDSLEKAVMDKLNPNKPNTLDTAGKTQITDPFKR